MPEFVPPRRRHPESEPAGDDSTAESDQTADAAESDQSGAAAAPVVPTVPVVRRKGRRVTTEPVPGTDPTPAPEPSRSSGTENDARLKADKPPHWG